MFTDLDSYIFRIKILQTINIIFCGIIAITSIIIPLLIFKNIYYIILGFVVGAIIAYIIYAINQLKIDKHKLQIDIYMTLDDKK